MAGGRRYELGGIPFWARRPCGSGTRFRPAKQQRGDCSVKTYKRRLRKFGFPKYQNQTNES